MNIWNQSKIFEINDNVLFHQEINLKKVFKSKEKDNEFLKKACNCKICDSFAANC